jgi:hypothetical protein
MTDISGQAETEAAAAAPAANGDQVTFGDRNVELSTFDRFKGAKGRTERFAIISKTLTRMWTFYYQGQNKQGTRFVAPTNAEVLQLCKKTLGEPEQRFGMVTFHYTTNELGELIDPSKLQGKFKPWLISENRFTELTDLHKNWTILDGGFTEKQVDILFKCTDDQYQKGTFTPTPTAHWKSKQAWYDHVKAKEPKVFESMKRYMGRRLSDMEIMALLGGGAATSPGSTDNAGSIDLSDIVGQ